jgi:hypothetical protein
LVNMAMGQGSEYRLHANIEARAVSPVPVGGNRQSQALFCAVRGLVAEGMSGDEILALEVEPRVPRPGVGAEKLWPRSLDKLHIVVQMPAARGLFIAGFGQAFEGILAHGLG